MPNEKVLAAKKAQVEELVEKFQSAVSGILVDYRGLTVEEDTNLRAKLREAQVEYKVVKNTLVRFAANQVGFEALDPVLNGPTSLALSFEDPVAAAKIFTEFAKENENLEIKAGFLDGKIIGIDEIKDLAKLPSKDVLIAKVMGGLNSPATKIACALSGIASSLARALDAVAQQKTA